MRCRTLDRSRDFGLRGIPEALDRARKRRARTRVPAESERARSTANSRRSRARHVAFSIRRSSSPRSRSGASRPPLAASCRSIERRTVRHSATRGRTSARIRHAASARAAVLDARGADSEDREPLLDSLAAASRASHHLGCAHHEGLEGSVTLLAGVFVDGHGSFRWVRVERTASYPISTWSALESASPCAAAGSTTTACTANVTPDAVAGSGVTIVAIPCPAPAPDNTIGTVR